MKIIDVKLVFAKHYLFVQIFTDSGIIGIGEAGNWGFLSSTANAICKFTPYLIGKDPFKAEDIFQNLYRAVYFRGSVIMSAISAIDIALWDIKGKALGVPVYQLLGGKTRNKVRAYASVMHNNTDNPSEMVDEYKQLQGMGFSAAKVFVNGIRNSNDEGFDEFYSNRVENELEKVRIIREAVGKRFDLILEVHRGMTVSEAITFGNEVARYRPMVIEDPVTPDNIDTMAKVTEKIPVPVATGERFINIKEYAMLMRHASVQYVRPDVCAVGGITSSIKIAAMAEANDILLIPHNPLGPVSTAACLQICAAIPNLGIQELPSFCLNGAEDKMVKEPIVFKDGFLEIPESPGIGIELSDRVEELYPAKERGSNYAARYYDGSVKDW
jgi:galactonate dehydratase